MKFIATLFTIQIVLSGFTHLYAQEKAHSQGLLITSQGEVIFADLLYYYQNEKSIQIKNDSRIQTFPINRIKSFSFQDEELDKRRFFAVYNTQPDSYSGHPEIFEQLLLGKLHFLRREQRVLTIGDRGFSFTQIRKGFSYYIYDGKNIIEIDDFEKQFSEIFTDKQILMDQFALSNHLENFLLIDQYKLVQHYNRLAKEEQKLLVGSTN